MPGNFKHAAIFSFYEGLNSYIQDNVVFQQQRQHNVIKFDGVGTFRVKNERRSDQIPSFTVIITEQ